MSSETYTKRKYCHTEQLRLFACSDGQLVTDPFPVGVKEVSVLASCHATQAHTLPQIPPSKRDQIFSAHQGNQMPELSCLHSIPRAGISER
jgi:hypothetical protein